MKNKQIVLVKDSLKPYGGLEKYARYLGKAFTKRGFYTTYLTAEHESPDELSFANAVALKINARRAHLRIQEFDRECQKWRRKHSPEVFFGLDRLSWQTHLRAGNGVHRAFLQHKYQGKNLIAKCRRWLNPLHRSILQMEKSAFENPHLQVLFTNSNMVRQEILEHYHVDEEKVQVVHNGVEWHEFHEHFSSWLRDKPQIAKHYKLDPNICHFLFIGHGFQRKGLEQLLRGLALLRRKNYHLSVLGREKNLKHYQRLAMKLGISSHVTFHDQQTPVSSLYQLCDCLVVPSLYDPFANVTVEALAMGLFVISSKYNGGHEILTPETGLVIEELWNPASICEALKAALCRPKTWQNAKLIRNSVEQLDFSKQLNKFVDLCTVK